MQQWIEDVFQKTVHKFLRSAPFAQEQGVIPYQSKDGRWIPAPFDGNSWWTGGFWPGLMWELYGATQEEVFRQEALRVEALLVQELLSFELLNHDVGFMYLLSTGAHYRLTGDKDALRHTLHAANLLAGRFNPAGFIRAWGGDRAGWSIIDCMMNLSLLSWASKHTGDPRFAKIARIHADTTIREFLRADGSCHHIVIFDPDTGIAVEKPRGQGYSVGSSWSRGQAWALHGFTLMHRNEGNPKDLEAACRVADYFVAHIRPDGLTDCDFSQPKEEERIDNIAAACAASGLLDLAELTGGEKGETYRRAAFTMLRAMDELCADWSENSPGILQKCTASYHEDGAGRHVNILYGDYFFVEALLKLRGTDSHLWLAKG